MNSLVPGRTPPYAAGDLIPLSQRVVILMAVRLTAIGSAATVALLAGLRPNLAGVELVGGFVAAHVMLGAAVIAIRHRPTALAAFGLMVMLDGVGVQYAEHRLGPVLGVDLLLATFLAAVCLVASYRNGIKLAVWQSMLVVMDDRAVGAGLLPAAADNRPQRIAAELILLWVLVTVICVAAAANERELRRRRYDAEALQDFSAQLHRDQTPDLVLERLRGFLVDELDAGRLLICGHRRGRLTVLQAHGPVSPAPITSGDRSALLELAEDPTRPALLLRLDPRRDPWLATLLPGARRLITVNLTGIQPDQQDAGVWAVFEHRGRSGSRVERRVVTTAGQAAAITRLALSRAELFEQARISAITDGLTGVANRRAFDDRLADLTRAGAPAGVAALLVDVDHFKSVNDTHGHPVGDLVLRQVATAIARVAPPGATVARYGGEEFIVLAPGLDESAGRALGETLRTAVAAITEPVSVTASVGVAVAVAGWFDPATLIAAADSGLYRAKLTGRNRVCLPPGPVPDPVGLGG